MKFLFSLLRLSGLPFLIRETIQKRKVTVILFHDIEAIKAKEAFELLKRYYSIISYQRMIEAIETSTFDTLPKKSLVITLDDGHAGNINLVPVTEDLKVPITIFLCSNIVGSNRKFWFLQKFDKTQKAKLKRMTNEERIGFLKDLGLDMETEGQPEALNKDQIRKMSKSEYIDFQSHTRTHPILPMCSNEAAFDEVVNSKKQLEETFDLNINSLSYPNGDYSLRDIELAKDANYTSGITVDLGFNSSTTDLFKLKRISISDNPSNSELIVKASGLWHFIRTLNGLLQRHGLKEHKE